jgi:hypothetical protein
VEAITMADDNWGGWVDEPGWDNPFTGTMTAGELEDAARSVEWLASASDVAGAALLTVGGGSALVKYSPSMKPIPKVPMPNTTSFFGPRLDPTGSLQRAISRLPVGKPIAAKHPGQEAFGWLPEAMVGLGFLTVTAGAALHRWADRLRQYADRRRIHF